MKFSPDRVSAVFKARASEITMTEAQKRDFGNYERLWKVFGGKITEEEKFQLKAASVHPGTCPTKPFTDKKRTGGRNFRSTSDAADGAYAGTAAGHG